MIKNTGEETQTHHFFMDLAIEQARKSASENGIPIGAVLVKNHKLIAAGHNKRVQNGSQILHAEIDCLQNAGRVKNFKGTSLYSTLMPCYMCAGAVVQFGIKTVIVGENKNFEGAEAFLKAHEVEVIVLESKECMEMLDDFISKNKDLWFEDIGVD